MTVEIGLSRDQEHQKLLEQQKKSQLMTLLDQTKQFSGFLAKQIDLPDPSTVSQSAILQSVTLRPYQLQGVAWLISLYENGLNGILADEMGLGKTLQTIAFLHALLERGVSGPFLVVGPLSTLQNWKNEFSRCFPQLPVLVYHGSKEERILQRQQLPGCSKMSEVVAVVTSYEMITHDRSYFRRCTWRYVVVDEAHRLKNTQCKLIEELREIPSHSRLLLTGTPLQNNLAELWSLLNFVLPDIFDELDTFYGWFSILEDESSSTHEQNSYILNALHVILRPFMLRRLKSDVEEKLPTKKEVILLVKLSAIQETLYHKLLRKLPLRLNSDSTKTVSVRSLQNLVMQLRKVCNHPYLLECPISRDTGELMADESLITSCGKMHRLDQLLRILLQEGHKILIFSQMTRMLDLIEEYLNYRGIIFTKLDGSVSQTDRASRIAEFNSPASKIAVFLLSTRAGGLGINLTAADTVIIYDSDWNPQVDLQAEARCHRIGQKKKVLVIRLATRGGTVEERILELAKRKRRLEQLVIQKSRMRNLASNELAMLLQRTENELGDPAEQESEDFNEAELDHLLDRDDCAERSTAWYRVVQSEPATSF